MDNINNRRYKIMAIDRDAIRKALDAFEDDKFSDSKDILSQEIGKVKNEFLKDKLGLQDNDEEE
jgi:hypothetical protein